MAFADPAWLTATRMKLTADGTALETSLTGAGFTVIGGTPLYRLAAHVEAPAWFSALGKAGILVRPFAERHDWLRFGIPAGNEAYLRLRRALGVT
jgi:cobalamin biosynthesis protein CobC